MKIARLSSCKNFVSKRERSLYSMRSLTFSQWSLEGFENGGDMSGFRSLNNSTSKRVLNLLEPVKLTVWKVMIERVTVVKFRVNYRGWKLGGS